MTKIYECRSCGRYFDEPDYRQTTYENYYGLNFPDSNPMKVMICPYCQEDEVEESDESLSDLLADLNYYRNYKAYEFLKKHFKLKESDIKRMMDDDK